MPGAAEDLLAEFWRRQDSGDYTAVVELFADDAVLVDPVFGTFEGKDAIAGFMARVTAEMAGQDVSFVLDDLAGDDTTAWAQWTARTPAGERSGCGVYRVHDGRMTYYRDYLGPPPR